MFSHTTCSRLSLVNGYDHKLSVLFTYHCRYLKRISQQRRERLH